MSDMQIADALARIAVTPPESPLYGFASDRAGHINLAFASTVVSQAWRAKGIPRFLGEFHRDHPPEDVANYLRDLLGEAAA